MTGIFDPEHSVDSPHSDVLVLHLLPCTGHPKSNYFVDWQFNT